MSRVPFETPAAGPGLLARLTSPTGRAVAVLAGITLAFYHRLWWPDLVLIKRDAFRFHLPTKHHLIERLSAGELPQWFPYDALGRPFIGGTHTGVFHPFTALYVLLPVPDAYRASTLISCLLGALGAYALGRVLHLSRPGALLAGIAFALAGHAVSMTDHIVYLYSLCALPLFCLGIEQTLRSRIAWAALPAVVWATVFLVGDVQTGYYYLFIALAWCWARAPGSRLHAGLRLMLIGCLAALLAGIQLGPAWAVFAGSDRTQTALLHEQALHWSTHPLRVATVLAAPVGEYQDLPDIGRFFFGNPRRPWSVWAESLYLGVPVVGLAFLGARQRRDLRVLTLLGTLALVLALGRYGGLYDILYQAVPLWSAFRYPEKLMGVVSFALAMLAGAGLDRVRAGWSRPAAWIAAAAVCAGAGLGLHTDTAGMWAAAEFGAPAPLARSVTESAAQALLFSAVAALGVGLAVFGARHERLRGAWPVAVIMAIVTLDLARANFAAYHTGPSEAATFAPPLADTLAAREGVLGPGRFRLISLRDTQYIVPDRVHRLLGHDAQAVEGRQTLALLHNAQAHIETVYAYFPGARAGLPPSAGLEAAARYNVRYYIGHHTHFRDPRLAHARVAELPDFGLALFHNPVPAKPRAYLSRQPERAASPVDPMVLLARAEFLDGEVDVIETSDLTLPGPATNGSALIERYDPEDVRVRVETPQPAVLILLDAYEQGWTATLDGGAELPLLRANALVRAVVVPAGTHVVTFSYQTPLLKAGAWASLAGVLLCLGLIVHAQRQRRPMEDHA
jgi:hypothetical protein